MSIDWHYITSRVQQYNSYPCDTCLTHDSLLYRIGTHTDVLTPIDCEIIDRQNNGISPEQRYRVLNWLCCNGFEIKGDLAVLIFGRQQLTQWLERSQQAYPDFEFYLVFEYQDRRQTGWESGINKTMFWMPLPGAPMPDTDNDFFWSAYWDSGELFWNDFPGGFNNEFDFTLDCYPDQTSFTKLGWICSEGDHYTTPTDEEADLMSVAQVLQHFAVPV